MTRPRTTLVAALLIILAFAAGAGSAWWWLNRAAGGRHDLAVSRDERERRATWYTCGMHPEVVQAEPGNCPKCGMTLQPMAPDRAAAMGLTTAPAAEGAPSGRTDKEDTRVEANREIKYWKSSMIPGEIHKEPGKDSMGMDLVPVYEDEVAAARTIQIDPVTEQNMGVRLSDVVRGPLVTTVRTVGFVDYDETSLATVTTKVDGWIEALYVDQTGVQVHRGEPLFELYSPALFSAQEEYLAALRNLQETDVPAVPRSRADSDALVRDARTRLEFFDISPEQIAELERTQKVRKTLTIRAQFTGIVTQKNVVEGQRVMAGMELFRIADLSTVWVMGKVFEYDLPSVHLGQEALMTLTYLPGKTFRGRVTYVYPYLEAKTREVPVRMEFHNPGYDLKPGMYATITLSREVATDATLVPDLAVINTGLRAVAFVRTGPGRFEAREVRTGVRGQDNYLEVLDGLWPGDTVVVSGQFLLDSESRLREAALKFMEPGQSVGASPVEAATEQAETAHGIAHPPQETAGAPAYYVCPMPQHTDILYEAPGSCPICGMKLVPVERRHGEVEHPRIAYWTCPMPEHGAVHEAGPGKCPICAMSLIPVRPSETPAPAAEAPRHEHAGAAGPETRP